MAALNVFVHFSWLILIPIIVASDPRIINGTAAIADNTRHQVSIRERNSETIFGTGHVCGGSLIAPTVVLSAAHCFYDDYLEDFYSSRNYFVVMGTLDRFEKTENTISLWITHIVYADFVRPTFQNDVALIFLDGRVPESNPAISVIPLNREEIPVGTVCQVTGWGVTEEEEESDILMTVDLPIIDKETCSTNYGKDAILDGQICAGYMEGEKDACQGDSGGPLVSQGKLVGIVSYGDGCALPGLPGVYTDVRHYVNWIEDTIKASSASLMSVSSTVIIFMVILISCLK